MTRRIALALGLAAVCAVALVGSAGGQAPPVTLAQVKSACEQSFSSTSPGTVEVATELRDANVEISIDAPCLVTLAPEASVTLNNVTLTSHVLNLVDDPEGPGANRIKLQHVDFEGRAEGGFLIELRDAADTLEVEHSELAFPRGIVFRVFGHRGEDNDGGSIRMEHTSLTAAAEAGEGVALVASEHTGTIELIQPTISTPAALVLIAGDCEATSRGEKLDCSTDTVAENLERQARELNP